MLSKAIRCLLLSLLLPTGILMGADAANDWPCFRGPNHDGTSPEKGINKDWKAKPPKVLWRVPMSDKGFAGPSVADGKVFIIDRKGDQDLVRALNLADGKDVWSFPYAEPTKENYGHARATPTCDGDKIYTLSTGGQLHCLNAADGKLVWKVNIQQQFKGKTPQWLYSMSVLIDGPAAIVCPGGPNASVAALNKADGKPIWAGGGSDQPGYATPVAATIQNVKQYVVFGGKTVFGVEAKSGKQLWQAPWETKYDVNAATPVVLGNSVFITSNYRRGCALVDVAAGGAKIRWENKEVQSHFNTAIVHEGNLYTTSDPNKLLCLDPQTGNARWTQNGFGKGGLVGVDGTLIVIDGVTGDVALVALDPAAYKELGRLSLLQGGGKQYWTAPIVAAGRLLVRDKTELVCLDLK